MEVKLKMINKNGRSIVKGKIKNADALDRACLALAFIDAIGVDKHLVLMGLLSQLDEGSEKVAVDVGTIKQAMENIKGAE